MKDPYVKIRLSELAYLNNTICMLKQRLYEYERPQQEIKLLDRNGHPTDENGQPIVHPLEKPGKPSVLETLPNTFTKEDAINKGVSNQAVRNWKFRGYITSNPDGSFTKTPKYIKRMEQTRLINITNENIVNIINN